MAWTQHFTFAGFHEKENSLETSIVMLENFSPKGFFRLNLFIIYLFIYRAASNLAELV